MIFLFLELGLNKIDLHCYGWQSDEFSDGFGFNDFSDSSYHFECFFSDKKRNTQSKEETPLYFFWLLSTTF